MLKVILVVGLIAAAPFDTASGACTFNTSLYSDRLQKLQNVRHIEITINKSRKWAVNGVRIIADRSNENIRQKFKRKFKAHLLVQYDFGSCSYYAKVRQNGDWKDHISIKEGNKITQSLDIKLENGNIASSVKFKLLIPETRGRLTEVFSTHLLRTLGFIAPRTSVVSATVNGVEAAYLFQEKESKEMLENVKRREGPMYEGDESLLWSYENFELFELESMSGASLVNEKWAALGSSSSEMSLDALLKLQSAYFEHAASLDETLLYLDPNGGKSGDSFPEFHALMLSMGGEHALRPHNRKFYWNALDSLFEPIYYDGNIQLQLLQDRILLRPGPMDLVRFFRQFQNLDFDNLIANVERLQTPQFSSQFAQLSLLEPENAKKYVSNKLTTIVSNLRHIKKLVKTQKRSVDKKAGMTPLRKVMLISLDKGVDQVFLEVAKNGSQGEYELNCLQPDKCSYKNVSLEQLSTLMNSNLIDEKRNVLVRYQLGIERTVKYSISSSSIGPIVHSPGASISEEDSVLYLKQTQADDWFLIKGLKLVDTTIVLQGKQGSLMNSARKQRFNNLGLTGCLNLYKLQLENVSITTHGGGCEDGLNIVSSTGTIKKLELLDAHSDAIDLDFSELVIGQVVVKNAGNDCLDVSGGVYDLHDVALSNCKDKGISVGEGSELSAKTVVADSTAIAVSSKDYSRLNIDNLSIKKSAVCMEAFQKKMEFGGGYIDISHYSCDNHVLNMDENSRMLVKGEIIELSN